MYEFIIIPAIEKEFHEREDTESPSVNKSHNVRVPYLEDMMDKAQQGKLHFPKKVRAS